MTAQRRLAIATLGFRGAGTGGGPGTTILVTSLEVALVDQDVSVALSEGFEVELTDTAFEAALAPAAFSVTVDAGFEVTLGPDLEIDLG